MESQQEQRAPPPAYSQHQQEQEHDPESLHLPSVPTHALPLSHNEHLPSIRSLALPNSTHDARLTTEIAPSSSHSQIPHMSYRTSADLPTLPPLNSAAFPRFQDSVPRTSGSGCRMISTVYALIWTASPVARSFTDLSPPYIDGWPDADYRDRLANGPSPTHVALSRHCNDCLRSSESCL